MVSRGASNPAAHLHHSSSANKSRQASQASLPVPERGRVWRFDGALWSWDTTARRSELVAHLHHTPSAHQRGCEMKTIAWTTHSSLFPSQISYPLQKIDIFTMSHSASTRFVMRTLRPFRQLNCLPLRDQHPAHPKRPFLLHKLDVCHVPKLRNTNLSTQYSTSRSRVLYTLIRTV